MQKTIITLLCAASMVISTTAATADTLRVRKNAPARYTVKQGDTLWGISGKYLYRPWKWPALWGMNRKQIRNPNLIYPGQTLVLTYVNGKPRLSVGRAARIVAGPDNRMYYSGGDRIYADGIAESGTYLVFRSNGPIIDPRSKANLGILVEFVGEASTLVTPNSRLSYRTAEEQANLASDEYYSNTKNGLLVGKKVVTRTAQPMIVDGALSEIHQGDYLIKKTPEFTEFHYMPHEPETRVDADIISIMEGVEESGTMQTLILNKGEADGLDNGTVLSIYRRGQVVKSDWRSPNEKATHFVNTPNEEIGLAMVYRTGAHVSSAIILESIKNVNRGDLLSTPGQDLDTFDSKPAARPAAK